MPELYAIKRFIERQKCRYRYAPLYVQFRAWALFSRKQRRTFETLAASVKTFKRSRLLAVGNEGLIYEGRYEPEPESRNLLKVSLNKNKRADWFSTVQSIVKPQALPWLCTIREHGLSDDGRSWYQVQEFVDGLMLSRYLLLPAEKQREIAEPAELALELIQQNHLLRRLRILAPNVDEENLILSPDGQLRRIDLDPYRHFPESAGPMPRWDHRRLFRVVRKILHPHVEYYRGRIDAAPSGLSGAEWDAFLRRLANSSVCTYGDPRKQRHGKAVAFGDEACFKTLAEPIEILERLFHTLQ